MTAQYLNLGPQARRGCLYYDGDCGFCLATMSWIEKPLWKRGFGTAPLKPDEPRDEMVLRLPDGRRFGGADAAVYLAGRVWYATPLWLLAWIPGVKWVMRKGYRWIAARRHCIGGTCKVK